MEAWLSSGLIVSPPPLDYECILNEPIWFNRFLYLPNDTKRGGLINPGLEKALLSRGFTHLADLLSSQLPAGKYDSPWLSLDEASFKAGSKRLGNALLSIIGLIHHAWSRVVSSRSREPFCIDDWISRKSEAHSNSPWYIYKVSNIMHGKLVCTRFRLSHEGVPFICSDSNISETISKAHASKACVLPAEVSPKTLSLLYRGNYSCTKLLLSRFSWKLETKTFSFFEYSIKYAYKAMLCKKSQEIAAIDRWEKALNHSIEHKWMHMMHYVNDPILNNKRKEKLYKILTRAMPVGQKFDRPGSSISSTCAFCNDYKDEMHCFVKCGRLRALWN
jgi:hypothetical protein